MQALNFQVDVKNVEDLKELRHELADHISFVRDTIERIDVCLKLFEKSDENKD